MPFFKGWGSGPKQGQSRGDEWERNVKILPGDFFQTGLSPNSRSNRQFLVVPGGLPDKDGQ
jgi:hypothetical protein